MWLSFGLAWIGAIGWPALIGLVLWGWITRRLDGRWKPKPWWAVAAVLVTPVWFLGIWAFLWEPETLVVRRIEVVSRQWSGPPLRIGVISDPHIGGPHMPPGRMRSIVRRMNGEHPDVVALLGDYVGGHVPAPQRSKGGRETVMRGLKALGGLTSPLGTYAVLGNHDWWYDASLVEAGLDAVGVKTLNNDAFQVAREGGAFWIAGLEDYESTRGAPSYTQSMRNVFRAEPVIALSHRPDKFAAAPAEIALTLAGHTHCGQVRLPWVGRYLPASSEESRRWPCGLYEDHGRRLYVTGGLGESFLPVRFRQPPEIVILTLRPDPSAKGGRPGG